MKTFSELDLPLVLKDSLLRINFIKPTPIQEQAIPPALSGRDILGSAETGTGKTAAFAIPLLTRLLNAPGNSALVMAPTRELAQQIMQVMIGLLGKKSFIHTAFLIGGDSMPRQMAQLRRNPQLVVGTPGRINDHLARRTLSLQDTGFLVLDETDRMLDMGFSKQIDTILMAMPKKRQTLMFSATIPDPIIKMAKKYLNNPLRIAIGARHATALNIKQKTVRLTAEKKFEELLNQLDQRLGSILVFVRTKRGADRLTTKLHRQRHSVDTIHGNLRQNRRERVIRAFRNKRNRILVATDVAARGLDIPHIEHVINYDLPDCPNDYIHRIGRTARAGAEGEALCLVAPKDEKKWKAIHALLR